LTNHSSDEIVAIVLNNDLINLNDYQKIEVIIKMI
jgi:hypothetical protein